MAPEQIGGSNFDRRADVFGMGCVLYETLTGVKPFRGDGDPQVMQAVLRGVYDPPVLRAKGLAPELSAVIDRALAPEPRMRFPTAERMRVALEEWLAKSGSVITPTQVGGLVRQRLGPELEKRREQVKASMTGADSGNSPTVKGIGHTPSRSQPGSRSGVIQAGVVPPMRDRVPSGPGYTPEQVAVQMRSAMAVPAESVVVDSTEMPTTRPPAMSMGQPPPQPQAQVTAFAKPPPTATKYMIAAIAGVVFAMIVGGIALAIVFSMRSREGEQAAPAEMTAPPSTLPPTASHAPSAVATAPAPPPPSASVAAVAPSATATTVDVSDLPSAKPQPWWATAPPPPRAAAAPTAPPPALPPALPPAVPTPAPRKNAPLPNPF
jgi:hypothetical protein